MKNGVPVPVKVGIFHVYYQGQNELLEPFPEDYSVVAGSPTRTEEEVREVGGGGLDWVCDHCYISKSGELIQSQHYEDSTETKEAWELPKKHGNGWLRSNVVFPTRVIKDEALGRYRECTTSKEEGCQKVMSMFFAIWYDARDASFFTFEGDDHLTLSSGGGTSVSI